MRSWIQRHFYEIQIALGLSFGFLLWRSMRRVRSSDSKSFFRTGPNETHQRTKSDSGRRALPGINLDGEPHQVLGIEAHASKQDILRAFRKLMKMYHPDKTRSAESNAIAQKIIEAKDAMLKRWA